MLVCIPCSVLLCAPHFFPKSRSVRDRNISAPSLGYQQYSQAAPLLTALRCAAQTGTPPLKVLDFIVQAKLAFLVQCYPKSLEGMPIGTRLGTIELCLRYLLTLIRLSANMYLQTGIKSNGDYADMNRDGYEDTFCFFLFCVLLHDDAMFLHTQRRLSKGIGPTGQLVHCPVRVGGKGNVDCTRLAAYLSATFFSFRRRESS